MKLHNYFRSSASFRVRIALQLKGLPYEYLPVHLVKGEHRQDRFAGIAPSRLVPVLETDGGELLSQSLAIMEYLDETHPEPALLPREAGERAHVRALALLVACEIHPLNNLRVLKYLANELKLDEETRNGWYRHWVRVGLEAYERELARLPASTYSCGDTPTIADCCLVPQIFNGRRVNTDYSGLDRTMRVFDACMELPAFQKAQPSAQPDSEP
ncbi:MAG TPA: maleylacetoacetate isomerase [Ramlibacter sp.]|uniref:maleylacetoacetate isomerase n=1 Tax=Ramlibacter sp. TaxID=1917967 RepID=UPI002C582F6C|nr:maleylacetoacetate isomerase [Ramlibacter sp.]HVZ46444.1 maleylacetoacetate isomerase [Ramlibacter sp.]